ncbi:hypothetical protein Q73_05840 [Bacillus coahuilensis m2-6]|uniref:YlxP-like protein n=1 Tax=Bacillus coahuilensis p1.1.43 TaxID=1150625 RepID=A0A147K9P7_9BACI|nr:DUF503 family protein [Bacillus coahuilensis]KUP07149.1 hypothetical protein Q75_06375 [Bacillus coahuilensis p1.1.43]KUP08702.1 hypothetical protein Q73_05840 [Bacillus coahuilensis m2-6]
MIGSLECEFFIPHVHSLKEKRSVLQKVLTRLKQKRNVSVAEIDHQDMWQRTRIAIVTVASSKLACEKELERCVTFLDSFPEWERTDIVYEWL